MPSRKIGDDTFVVIGLPARKSFALQPRILPLIGEVGRLVLQALGQRDDLVDGIKKQLRGDDGKVDIKGMSVEKFLELDLDLGKIGDLVAQSAMRLAQAMPPDELEIVTRTLLQGATCNKKLLFKDDGSAYFDVAMKGKTLATWQLLYFAVQVNYPDLFSLGTSGSAPPVPEDPPAESSSPASST